jgi:undecaprenyl-diphosphatase
MGVKESFNKLIEWDHKVFLKIYRDETSRKYLFTAKVISFFGNIYFWIIIAIIIAIANYVTKDYYLSALFFGGFDQSFFFYVLMRYVIVKRNRPYITLRQHNVQKEDELTGEHKSFPSGHVTFFIFFCYLFSFYFNFWPFLLIGVVLGCIIGITRITLGVHFPLDVIFGVVFGFVFSWFYLYVTAPFWVEFYYLVYDWLAAVF